MRVCPFPAGLHPGTPSQPLLFVSFASHSSRNVPILVGDDRTHKVTSAYMHVVCAYRRAGCPFILKLTKAKEGGWIIKGAKGPDSASPLTSALSWCSSDSHPCQ